jgi:hypothetical protein
MPNESDSLPTEQAPDGVPAPETDDAERPVGRPSLYRPEYARIAYLHCLKAGATDAELAELFDVAESTINNWKHDHPEFLESIKKGKAPVDDKVEDALLSRALGYMHPDVHVAVVEKKVVLTDLVKHYPPSEVACIFWLKNRRPETWREKSTVEHEGLNLEQLVAEARKLPAPEPQTGNGENN